MCVDISKSRPGECVFQPSFPKSNDQNEKYNRLAVLLKVKWQASSILSVVFGLAKPKACLSVTVSDVTHAYSFLGSFHYLSIS